MRRSLIFIALLACACLPDRFDALAEAAPVTSVALEVEITMALTVAADDEGRGRVLFGDGHSMLGWYRIQERGGGDLRFADGQTLAQLATHAQPTLTGIAVVGASAVAEGLVRIAGHEQAGDRIVRFRIADFSRSSAPELDMIVYPWVGNSSALLGPLAAVQLDEGLFEALSGSADGLMIWDGLGARIGEYTAAREQILADDPNAFENDPHQGLGLTRCPELHPTAIAGGRLLADQRRAAIVLAGEILTMVGAEQPPTQSLIGAPIYSCDLMTLELPAEATNLQVVDLEHDGTDDLLVGAPAHDEVWIYENHGDGLPAMPTRVLMGDEPGAFGTSLAYVELGGEAPAVILVGAPETSLAGKTSVGRVYVFDAGGELLRTLEDLDPQASSRHGLGVHGLDLPGREEPVVTGARELRIHWTLFTDDPRP